MFAVGYFPVGYFGSPYFAPGAQLEAEAVGGWYDEKRKRRFVLPDGKVITDPTEAYAEFERQLRARAAELESEFPAPKRPKKRKRSRSIHPKRPPIPLQTRSLPQIIERLPEAERAGIDLELVALVSEVAKRRDDEEALILLLT